MKKVLEDIISLIYIMDYFSMDELDIHWTIQEMLKVLYKKKEHNLIKISPHMSFKELYEIPSVRQFLAAIVGIDEKGYEMTTAFIINVIIENSCNSNKRHCLLKTLNYFYCNFETAYNYIKSCRVKIDSDAINNQSSFTYEDFKSVVKWINPALLDILAKEIKQYKMKNLYKEIVGKREELPDKVAERYADSIMKELYYTDPYYRYSYNHSKDI